MVTRPDPTYSMAEQLVMGKRETMVSYDDAVAIIQDPQADPVTLAKVAYENPEFGANVAAHPRAYPGLLRWIAQFGDERARKTAAQLGYETQLGPIEDRQVDDVALAEAAEHTPAASDYAEPQPQPVSFDPVPRTGVDMLSEHFDNIGMEAHTAATDSPATDSPAADAAPQQQIQATNPYGFTAETAMTTADTGVMQQIAQYAPELHPALALNPYLYPELLTWLGMLGEPATNAALAQRPQH